MGDRKSNEEDHTTKVVGIRKDYMKEKQKLEIGNFCKCKTRNYRYKGKGMFFHDQEDIYDDLWCKDCGKKVIKDLNKIPKEVAK